MSELTIKIGSGATPRGGERDYKTNGIPLIRSMNVYDLYFQREGLAFIDDEQASALDNVTVQAGDVLLNITGASVARCCVVPDEFVGGRVNQHVTLLRPRADVLDSGYLSYVLVSREFKTLLLNLANVGGTREALTKGGLERFEIPIPPISQQKRIASILGAYDELIEVNRRRIGLLEETVRRLFDEWFVHFRFPGHERCGRSEEQAAPADWRITKVQELVERQRNGRIYRAADCESSGLVIVVDQSSDEMLGFHSSDADHQATPDNPIVIFGDHTCKMQLLVSPFSMGPNTIALKAKGPTNIYYLFSLIRGLTQTKEYKRHWNDLMSNQVRVAPHDLTTSYSNVVKPLFQFQENLQRQNRVLRRQRDLLLPRLISGKHPYAAVIHTIKAVA